MNTHYTFGFHNAIIIVIYNKLFTLFTGLSTGQVNLDTLSKYANSCKNTEFFKLFTRISVIFFANRNLVIQYSYEYLQFCRKMQEQILFLHFIYTVSPKIDFVA